MRHPIAHTRTDSALASILPFVAILACLVALASVMSGCGSTPGGPLSPAVHYVGDVEGCRAYTVTDAAGHAHMLPLMCD